MSNISEQSTLEKIFATYLQEQRRSRIAKNIFRGFILLILVFFLFAVSQKNHNLMQPGSESKHVAMITLKGVIEPDGEINADDVTSSLENAFEAPNSVGVILRMNSPGGSPVQSDLIYNKIKQLRKEHNKPVYAVVDDICASGGYYIASAADKIYVNQASIIGSIGVLMDGFGFTDLMQKLGVERRLLTAGAHKGMLDPFSPVKPEEKAYTENMLNEVHQQFITAVKAGRGVRLKLDTPDLFSGVVWTGQAAVQNGVADAFGNVSSVSSGAFGTSNVVDYTINDTFAERLAERFGAAVGQGATRMLMEYQAKMR